MDVLIGLGPNMFVRNRHVTMDKPADGCGGKTELHAPWNNKRRVARLKRDAGFERDDTCDTDRVERILGEDGDG